MTDLISLDDVRRARRPDYVDRAGIETGCDMIERCVAEMVKGSHDAFGGIDPLAHELNAHVLAIRRAMAATSDPPG